MDFKEIKLILAPMAAVNCPAFRVLCRRHGADLTYTQMIDTPKKIDRILGNLDDQPLGVQIVGSDIEILTEIIKKVEDKADFIDINLGCAETEILGKQAGCFLMKHPDQMQKLVSQIVKLTDKPVTAKIRSGWDNNSINAVEVAVMLEKLGIKAIAVHPRTRKQKYSGRANWNIIRDVKQSVKIPVIGNGDVRGTETAQKMKERTGCDAVMIGRAAIGNPLIFKGEERTYETQKKLFVEFLEIYRRQEFQTNGELQQHANWFFKGVQSAKLIKEEIRLDFEGWIKNI